MRHKKHSKHFGRTSNARKALLRGLVQSMVKHERIETTVPKAKELRRHVEKAVTQAKRGDFNAARLLLSDYPDKPTVKKLLADLAPRFKDRPGGYTRIIKMGPRRGDGAEVAWIEFVDFDHAKFDTAVFNKPADEVMKAQLKHRSVRRKMQSEDRRLNRA